jgi:hypothetical protein
MRTFISITAIYLLLYLTFPLSAMAQSDSMNEAFASVPAPLRTRLMERFRLMADSELTAKWGELYDLLIKPQVQSKEEFVEQRLKDSINQGQTWIVGFAPQKVDQEQPVGVTADYRIIGYAKVRERGCVVKRRGVIFAFLRDGEWYFSGFFIELTPSHTAPPPCLSDQSR